VQLPRSAFPSNLVRRRGHGHQRAAVNGLPSFTAKLTVTFSGFVFGAVPVMVVVVDNGVALTVCVRVAAE